MFTCLLLCENHWNEVQSYNPSRIVINQTDPKTNFKHPSLVLSKHGNIELLISKYDEHTALFTYFMLIYRENLNGLYYILTMDNYTLKLLSDVVLLQ